MNVMTMNKMSDWTDLTEKPNNRSKELFAYCNSQRCSTKYSEYFGVIKRNIKKTDNYCPDCKSALFWGPKVTKGGRSFNNPNNETTE